MLLDCAANNSRTRKRAIEKPKQQLTKHLKVRIKRLTAQEIDAIVNSQVSSSSIDFHRKTLKNETNIERLGGKSSPAISTKVIRMNSSVIWDKLTCPLKYCPLQLF